MHSFHDSIIFSDRPFIYMHNPIWMILASMSNLNWKMLRYWEDWETIGQINSYCKISLGWLEGCSCGFPPSASIFGVPFIQTQSSGRSFRGAVFKIYLPKSRW